MRLRFERERKKMLNNIIIIDRSRRNKYYVTLSPRHRVIQSFKFKSRISTCL